MKKLKFFLPFLIASWHMASAQTIKKDVAYGDDAKQKFDVYLPQQTKNKVPAIILIHGGSWIGGDKINMTHWLKPLQTAFPDDAIFTINYRLASREKLVNAWPTQINDVNAAIGFIQDHAKEYNINKKQLVLLGESAGAQLALVKGFNYDPDRDVKVVVDLFGPADMADLYTAHRELAILMQGTPE
ncbi:MAG: alpha/beta hydrolase, partial [Sphingobacteriaceae bacterium]